MAREALHHAVEAPRSRSALALLPDFLGSQDAGEVARQITATIDECTRANVKRCTTLILRKVAGHYKRTTAVCAYLIELSLTITVPSTSDLARDNGDPRLAQRRKPPNAVMRRLHMVYIVNDVVSTLAAALGSKDVKDAQAIKNSRHAAFVHLKQTMRDLLELVCASAEVDLPTSHYQRIRQITGLWEKAAYFPNLDNLTAYLDKTSAPGQSLDQDAKDDIEYRVGEKYRTQLRSVHFWITRRHGGEVLRGNAESTSERVPWFNLPAANGLYLRRSRGYPLKAYALPVHGFEIEGGGALATVELEQEVEALVFDMEQALERHTPANQVVDIDPEGDVVWKDVDRRVRNYYGFTKLGVKERRDIEEVARRQAVGYADVSRPPPSVNVAVDRARQLAANQRGNAGGRGGRGDWGGRGDRGGAENWGGMNARGGRGGWNGRGGDRGGMGGPGGRGRGRGGQRGRGDRWN